jgi:hypothetical protein
MMMITRFIGKSFITVLSKTFGLEIIIMGLTKVEGAWQHFITSKPGTGNHCKLPQKTICFITEQIKHGPGVAYSLN